MQDDAGGVALILGDEEGGLVVGNAFVSLGAEQREDFCVLAEHHLVGGVTVEEGSQSINNSMVYFRLCP